MTRPLTPILAVLTATVLLGCADDPSARQAGATVGSGGSTAGTGGAGGVGGAPASDPSWSRAYGGPMDDVASGLVVDAAGHAFFAAMLDDDTLGVPPGAALVEVDAAGTFVHARAFGYGPNGYLPAFAAAPTGGLVLMGSFQKSLDLGDGCALQATDARFLAKLDAAGHCVWARSFAASFSASLSVSPSGEIALAGVASSGGDLGNGVTLPVYPGWSPVGVPFVAVFDASGKTLRAWTYGSEMSYGGLAWARFDAGGALVVVGEHPETIQLDPSHSLAPGGFVARYTPDGALAWAEDVEPLRPRALALDPAGNVIVAGKVPAGTVVQKLRAKDGAVAWSRAMTDGSAEVGIATDGTGNVLVAGGLAPGAQAKLGGDVKGSGPWGFFDAKLDSEGNVVRAHRVAADGEIDVGAVVASAHGDLWVLGAFNSTTVDLGYGAHTKQVGETEISRDVFLLKRAP